MSPLSELFSRVWDAIEASLEPVKRPRCAPDGIAGAADPFESPVDRFPVSAQLECALAAAERSGQGVIAKRLRAAGNLLPWSQNASYAEAKLGHHFLDNYVSGMLTGPDGNLARDAPCSGFLLLGPGTEYPQHSHGPAEVYLVLTPGSEWRLDGTRWFGVEAGQVIHHAPWQNHAMRTHDTPMLAFAAWLDDGDRRAISI